LALVIYFFETKSLTVRFRLPNRVVSGWAISDPTFVGSFDQDRMEDA
jgi:hypothetical protein